MNLSISLIRSEQVPILTTLFIHGEDSSGDGSHLRHHTSDISGGMLSLVAKLMDTTKDKTFRSVAPVVDKSELIRDAENL